MLGFKYNVIFLFGFEAPTKYAPFLFFCQYVFNSPWCPKLIHINLIHNKFQSPSTKFQINNKFQLPKDQNVFCLGHWNLEHWSLFVIWDL